MKQNLYRIFHDDLMKMPLKKGAMKIKVGSFIFKGCWECPTSGGARDGCIFAKNWALGVFSTQSVLKVWKESLIPRYISPSYMNSTIAYI